MPCFRPLTGYRSKNVNAATGKRAIVFDKVQGFKDMPITLPCGQCRWCRLEKSRQWAMRCVHESMLHNDNCFITLTYSNEFLPPLGTLDYDAPVLFMKRLRKRFGNGIRSFGCAEYGEQNSRPHYHLCIFGMDFPDKVLTSKAGSGYEIYESEILAELWPYGKHSIGALTFESAAYTARYVCKKMTGDKAEAHYRVVDNFGEILGTRLPEKTVCVSRRPGLGKPWFEKFSTDMTNYDYVVFDNKKMRPPKYYDRLFEVAHPDEYAINRLKRNLSRRECRCGYKYCLHVGANDTPARLSVRERLLEYKFKKLERGFENA